MVLVKVSCGRICEKFRTDFAGFILRHFVLGMLLAIFSFAVCTAGFGYVDLAANID